MHTPRIIFNEGNRLLYLRYLEPSKSLQHKELHQKFWDVYVSLGKELRSLKDAQDKILSTLDIAKIWEKSSKQERENIIKKAEIVAFKTSQALLTQDWLLVHRSTQAKLKESIYGLVVSGAIKLDFTQLTTLNNPPSSLIDNNQDLNLQVGENQSPPLENISRIFILLHSFF